MLSGFKSKSVSPEPDNCFTFVNELNTFYSRFEGNVNFKSDCDKILKSVNNTTCPNIFVSESNVFQKNKIW